jgi:predicted nuclease with TOPRIM domain
MTEYETNDVINKINGLNSKSTFNRWRKLAEDLCNVQFKQQSIKIARNAYTKIYLFTEDEVSKFQLVSDLKNKGHHLKKAVESAFLTKEERQKNEEITMKRALLENYIDPNERLKECVTDLDEKLNQAIRKVTYLEQIASSLQKDIQYLESSKLDKPFQKKRT